MVTRLHDGIVVQSHNAFYGCWEWSKQHDRDGYAVTNKGHGRPFRAHRASYEEFIGPIPDGLTIDHLCRNRGCVNPYHLEPVTNRENLLRGLSRAAINARKTHCKRGHILEGTNLRVRKKSYRECWTCHKMHDQARRARISLGVR